MTGHFRISIPRTAFFLLFSLIFLAYPVTLYVSPNGDDSNDGSESAPFKTLHHARDKLREESGGEKVVILRGGNYFLDSTLHFDENDCGTAQNPVVWKAYDGETPSIFGGKRITGWQQTQGNIYKAYCGSPGAEFWTLSENGERATPARHPNYVEGTQSAAASGTISKTEMSYNAGDFPSSWEFAHTRVVQDANGWFPEIRPISTVDFGSRIITIDPGSWKDRGPEIIVEGSVDFIDTEGEWALDADGYVHYWPKNSPIDDQVIVGGSMLEVVKFMGSSSSSPVHHIVLEGLVLSTSDCTPVGTGSKTRIANPSQQSNPGNCEDEYMHHGLVHIENAEHITVKYCKILNAGIFGVLINKHAQYNTIYGNWIGGTNFHAVLLNSYCANIGPWDYINHHNKVISNYIVDHGMLYSNGSAVQLFQSGDNTISHNEIRGGEGGRRYAISQKGQMHVTEAWIACTEMDGCLETMMLTKNNEINFNFIADAMSTTRDLGAYESWRCGLNHGIINNCFHDMVETADSHDPRRQCIYLDDSWHFAVMRNLYFNIVEAVEIGTKSWSSVIHINDGSIVANEAAAQAQAESHPLMEWETIGLLADFPWQTPMGKGTRSGMSFDVQPSNGAGLYGEYFNNTDLSGTPVMTRIDPIVNYIFAKAENQVFHQDENGNVVDSIGIGELSIRWTGTIIPHFSENYTFYVTSCDGMRLYIDDQSVIDHWQESKGEKTGSIDLTAGQSYDIKLEYFHSATGRNKGIQLRWQSPSQYYSYVPQSQLLPPGSVSASNKFQAAKTTAFSVRRVAKNLVLTTGSDNLSRVEIVALNGRIVRTIHCRGSVVVPTETLAQGAYLARLATSNGIAVRRFIVR
ncbi:MAG: T9SS type A sorting domain-containing protein [Chitinivibrionales bacterium]|nr:T9SS type A sorting domain-containing protein [Chitinivibrionales bacterium]